MKYDVNDELIYGQVEWRMGRVMQQGVCGASEVELTHSAMSRFQLQITHTWPEAQTDALREIISR